MRLSALPLFTLCLIAATALADSTRDADVLAQAQRMQLEYRQGNTAIAKPLVTMLEAAVARSSGNAELWEALGHAHMSLQGALYASPPDLAALIANGERARAAYARALSLDADNILAKASHGMASFVVSQLQGDGPGMRAGVEEMNAVVAQAPRSTLGRLTRGFTIIHLPPAQRDTRAVIEDLEFILDAAPGGRPEGVLHLLLGDVHAEMGDLKAARAEYEQVGKTSAFAAAQVKLRLADLEKGAIPPASIATVRRGTGTQCAVCHAPGVDN